MRKKIICYFTILFIAIIFIAIQVSNESNISELKIESSDNINAKENIINWYIELSSLSQDNLIEKESITIRYMPDASLIDISNLENEYNLQDKKSITCDDFKIYSYALPGDDVISLELIREINDISFVKYAEPNYKCSSLDYTDSSTTNSSINSNINIPWGLSNQIYPGIDIDVKNAWRITKGSPSVIVAEIDSGVDYNHSELKDNIWVNKDEIPNNGIDDDNDGYIDDTIGWNFNNDNNNPMDGFNHGTHVAGIISGDENQSMSGVAPNVRLMPLKIFANNGGLSDYYTIITAIEYAHEHGASIVNMSFGSRGMSQSLYDVMNRYKDMLFVTAAGNNGSDIDVTEFFPASFDLPNSISVASIDQNGDISNFSNYGIIQVDVAAPGKEIYSTLPNNKLGYMSGTSMAAPYVSGVAALIKSDNMKLDPTQIKQIIMSSSKPLPSLEEKIKSGGLVDAGSALANDNVNISVPVIIPKAIP
ncbi:MAG: S8 family serine peptidase [Oscillospiraceae bacterium]|nr:S8 family serine peptidase [Oscillospiraceae bacterium]